MQTYQFTAAGIEGIVWKSPAQRWNRYALTTLKQSAHYVCASGCGTRCSRSA